MKRHTIATGCDAAHTGYSGEPVSQRKRSMASVLIMDENFLIVGMEIPKRRKHLPPAMLTDRLKAGVCGEKSAPGQ